MATQLFHRLSGFADEARRKISGVTVTQPLHIGQYDGHGGGAAGTVVDVGENQLSTLTDGLEITDEVYFKRAHGTAEPSLKVGDGDETTGKGHLAGLEYGFDALHAAKLRRGEAGKYYEN